MIEIDSLQAPTEVQTANRSRAYHLLAQSFGFPSAAFYELIRTGEYWQALSGLLSELPFDLRLSNLESPAAKLGAIDVEYQDFEAAYIRLFDIGATGRPPCPLHAGEYATASRLKVMEELIRCYEYFGLTLPERDRELPDHVTTEFEFMHYLAFKEAHALHTNLDPAPYRRAQADFLERHPATWLPLLRRRLSRQQPLAFFEALVGVTDELVRADLGYLNTLAQLGS